MTERATPLRDDHAPERAPETPPGLPAPAPRNLVLRALPAHELARLWPQLEPVTLAANELVVDAGRPSAHLHFPEDAALSVVRRLGNGASMEVGSVGYEGAVGLPSVLGDAWSPAALTGQLPGRTLRASRGVVRAMLPELPALAALLGRAAQAFTDQLGQNVACATFHSVEQRCARWLLAAVERRGGGELPLTHDAIAHRLGVRRAGVTAAALKLQHDGVIAYARGRVTVLDRAGLARSACECHAVLRAHHERLFAPARAAPPAG